MRLYRRGPTWWVYYLARDGEKVRRSTRQTDRKRADHIAREWERRDADPTYTAAHEAALDDAVKTFLADRKQRGRADATIAFYGTKAGHLVRLLPEHLSAIDARAVDRYIATRAEEGFWRWLETLKIGHLSPNDLRRSLGRWLRSHGVEPQLIGAMLGHADGRMSERVYGRMPVTSLGPVIESRFAVEPVHQVYTSEAKGADLGDVCVSAPPMIAAISVPGDGIEPPTRGFSIQHEIEEEGGNMQKATCAVHHMYTARLAKCGPLDPDGAFAALELAEVTGTWGES